MEGPFADLAYLERFCKGDRARMEKYVRMYLDASPGLFAQLVEKAVSGDAEGLAVAAHSLRPQVNYMGAQMLFDLLTAIEVKAREAGTAACAEMVAQLPALNERVMAALRTSIDPV
jgi:HPt (histidine-containing phosphotransfer) domain-containing protein